MARKAKKMNDPEERSKKMQEAKALLLDDSGDTEPPVCRRYVTNDATVEKLGELLAENPSGLLLSRDELAGWISKLQQPDHQTDRAFYLEAYNGNGSFNCDRIGRGSIHIPSNTVSVIGGIQPKKLKKSLMSQRSGDGDDGFVERLQLMVYPDEQKFEFTDRSPDVKAKEQAYDVFNRLAAIEYKEDAEDRTALRFDLQAQEVFNDWYQALVPRLRKETSTHIESHLAKYPSLMISLALIFHIVDHGPEGSINRQTAEMAIRWCDVLETHARRIYALADDPMEGARTLIERLHLMGGTTFKMINLTDKGWAGLREKSEKERALAIAQAHGYVMRNQKRNKRSCKCCLSHQPGSTGRQGGFFTQRLNRIP